MVLCLQILSLTTEQIKNRVRILDSNIGVLNSEMQRLERDRRVHEARLKDNMEKIKLNKQLPFLVSNVVEVCGQLGCRFGAVLHTLLPFLGVGSPG
jgi:ATP-dependent 26S proteasome regulatory subunit